MPTDRDAWHNCAMVKDSFWSMLNELLLESVEADAEEVYQTLSEDNNDGEGMLINPSFIWTMRVEKAEAACAKILFESKS